MSDRLKRAVRGIPFEGWLLIGGLAYLAVLYWGWFLR